MWSSGYYFFIILIVLFLALFQVTSLTTFAIYSELFWLNIYVLTALSGSFINSPELFSVPFLILVLTAVEAVVIWTFIISNNFKNN